VDSLEPLTAERHEACAGILADAFLDDPGWLDVGPSRRVTRRRYIYRTCLGAMRVGARWCGPSWCAIRDGEPVAVLTGCAPGAWPPPRVPSLLHAAPGPLLAGPGTLARSIRAELMVERFHPRYDHFLVWMFAVSPRHQRSGLGGRLMRAALEQADRARVPAYLWTGNPANLPYYRSHDFEVIGEQPLPRGAPNWFMQRPVPGG
jgi:GNAT superfamily N-acetyltransferase